MKSTMKKSEKEALMMPQRIARAARATWQSVGNDLLSCSEEAGQSGVPQDAVLDSVYNHIEQYGRDSEAAKVLLHMPVQQGFEVLKSIFPNKRYS